MNRYLAGAVLLSAAMPSVAIQAATMTFECKPAATKPAKPPEFVGLWDIVMDVRGTPSFGLLSLGRAGAETLGSIALQAGVVVVRSFTVEGGKAAMVVATTEGDVRFDADVAGDGSRMCGTVTYHGGEKLPMIAQKRGARTPQRPQTREVRSQKRLPAFSEMTNGAWGD